MHYKLQIPNAKSVGQTEVVNPYNQNPIGTVEKVDATGVEQALKNASEAFANREAWLPAHERVNILRKAADLMTTRFDELVGIAVAEGGKPFVDTKVELNRAIDGIHNCIECIRSESGREIPMQINPASMNRLAFTHREPIGVVVALSAFNHPINLIVHQIGPAIASGCPVIIKPAEDTPLSAFALVELFREAGLPDIWCQGILTDSHETTGKLVSDSRVAFFSFIGSARVGWMLRSQLAAGTRCALEHGGAAPVILAEDADLNDVLPLLTKGGFYHAGQVCVSVQRIFAHQSIAKEVANRLAELGNAMTVGDAANETTEVGPLIRPHETDRIESWVNEAVDEGAELISGGKRLGDSLYAPTVLLNPVETSKVSQSEIFGPVICVYAYDDMDTAIEQANNVPYSFQASVCTQNIDKALYAYKKLNASAVMINDHTAFRVDWMPFAGFKESGYGTGGIPYTYRDMQVEKMAVIRSKAL